MQAVPHLPVDVKELGVDFYAWTGHKAYGPTGIGVLHGRRELLEAMPPYHHGSNMAHDVGLDEAHLSEGALKFGAGSPNVSGAMGLAVAMRFLRELGFDVMRPHQETINRRMLDRLAALPAVRLLGSSDAAARVGVFAFVAEGRTPLQLVTALDADGIAIRGGDLSARPTLERFGCRAAARASCYLYTSEADVDRFADALARAVRRA
jgi:cysteine desulfurase/selenocysteine lyase